MRRLDIKIVRSTTHPDNLSLRDEYGSGSGLKRKLSTIGFQIGDDAVIVLREDLENLLEEVGNLKIALDEA